MLRSVVSIVTGGHIWVYGPAAMSMAWGTNTGRRSSSVLLPEARLMSMGLDTSREHVVVSRLCWHMRPCWCPHTRRSLGAVLAFMAYTAIRDYGEVCDICWCWRSGRCQWLMLLPANMWKFMIQVPVDYKGLRSFFWSGLSDYRLTYEKERHRRLLWQPPSLKKGAT